MSAASGTLRREVAAGRPRLTLLEREGDPVGAVALAVTHERGWWASEALAQLLQRRLSAALRADSDVQVSALGVVWALRAGRPEELERALGEALRALATPLRAGPALTVLTPGPPSEAERRLVDCSAEAPTAAGRVRTLGVPEVERLRESAATATTLSVAVVGGRAFLEAGRRAVERLPVLARGASPAVPWPRADGAWVSPGGERSLSLAWRVPEPGAAVKAVQALGQAPWTDRLTAIAPGWQLAEARTVTHRQGACVKLTLTAGGGAEASIDQAARLTLVAEAELQRALRVAASEPSQALLDAAAARAPDPRDAARRAAWFALSAPAAGEPLRRAAVLREPEGPLATDAAFTQALQVAERARAAPFIERAQRVERGQGELWVLLAGRCGTLPEGTASAGLTGLALRALAPRSGDVVIEPWASVDGAGLLAHAAPLGARETPEQLAERVGARLGRVLASARLSPESVLRARSELLEELSPGQRAGYDAILDALVPGHGSWLDPRGNLLSIGGASAPALEATRRALVSGPLKIAVLANHDARQAELAAKSAEQWLWPLRDPGRGCPAPSVPEATAGQRSVRTRDAAGLEPEVVVGVRLDAGPHEEWVSEATVWLLNREGGWLSRALSGYGAARAYALGGAAARALVIELRATTDVERAKGQLRALLARLSEGAVEAKDYAAAVRALAQARATLELDPRRRIVQLWRRQVAPPTPSLEEYRRALRALAPERHLLVGVERED